MAYITKKSEKKPEMLGDVEFKLDKKPKYIKKKEKKTEYITKKEKKPTWITKKEEPKEWITKKEYPIIGKDY